MNEEKKEGVKEPTGHPGGREEEATPDLFPFPKNPLCRTER